MKKRRTLNTSNQRFITAEVVGLGEYWYQPHKNLYILMTTLLPFNQRTSLTGHAIVLNKGILLQEV